MQGQFVAKVIASRKLSPETARRLADGRVYTAEQARAAGLVDAIGYMTDAVATARRAAGVEEARVVVYHRPRQYRTYFARSEGARRHHLLARQRGLDRRVRPPLPLPLVALGNSEGGCAPLPNPAPFDCAGKAGANAADRSHAMTPTRSWGSPKGGRPPSGRYERISRCR